MKVLKGFIVCALAVVFYTSAKPSERSWSLYFNEAGISVWRLKANQEVKGVYHTDPSTPGVNWDKFTSTKVFRDWEEPKKKIMEALGITNWVADDYEWGKEGQRHRFAVSGSYTNSKKKKVYFYEVQYYTADVTLRLLVTSPDRSILRQSAVQNGFIQRVKQESLQGGA